MGGMPSLDLFFVWCTKDATVRKAFNAAREMSAFSLEEDALWQAKKFRGEAKTATATEARALEMFLNQSRWSIENRNPSSFGNKAKVSLTVPIQINTTLDMGGEQQGTKEHPHIYRLTPPAQVEPVEVELEDAELPKRMSKAKRNVSESVREARRAKMHEINARRRARKEAERGSDNPQD